MKIFWNKESLDNYVAADRSNFMEATARNAASKAIHHYLCKRTLDWWRQKIDEAEKDQNKYVRLADLVAEIEKENLK